MCDPIISKSISCEDLENTVTLPVNVNCNGLSGGIQEYSTAKQKSHDECFSEMRTKLKSINFKSDEEIKELTELLQEELQLLDGEMQKCLLDEITGMEQLSGIQSKFNKLDQRVKTILTDFHLDLSDLERKRCENIKMILGQHKEEAVKIRYLSSENIEQIFEDIIDEINHEMLDNLRHCEDLKLQYQINADTLTFKNKQVFNRMEKHVLDQNACDQLGKERSEQFETLIEEVMNGLHESSSKTKEELDQALDGLIYQLSDLTKIIEISETQQNDKEYLEILKNELEQLIESTNMCCLNLEEKLKSTIENLIQKFNDDKNTLVSFVGNDLDLLLKFSVLEERKNQELELLQFWHKVIDELLRTLDSTKQFCFDIISFWINNIDRLSKIRLDLKTKFESSIQKSLKKEQDFNSKIKTQAKALREAPDKSKLELGSHSLDDIFTKLLSMWTENFDLNIKAIREIRTDIGTPLVTQTINESNYLLEKYPKNIWFARENYGSFDKKHCSFSCLNLFNSIDALEDKTSSIREDIEKYINDCASEIDYGSGCTLMPWIKVQQQYDCLFEDAEKNNNEVHDNIFNELNERAKNLENIKKIRIAELEIHWERSKSHQAGVNLIMKNLLTKYEEVKYYQELKLGEFNNVVPKFDEIQQIVTRDQIKNIINKLEQEWNSLSIDLENRTFDAKMNCQHNFETLKHSNDSFLRIAKNFKNGGNYSANELKLLDKELKQLEKSFSEQNKTLSNKYNALLSGVSRKELDTVMQILKDKYEETNLTHEIEESLTLTRIKLRYEINKTISSQEALFSKIKFFLSIGTLNEHLFDEICLAARSYLDDMSFEGLLECESEARISKSSNVEKPSGKGVKETKKDSSSDNVGKLMQSITAEDLKGQSNFLSRVKSVLIEKYLALIQVVENNLRPKSVEQPKLKKKEMKIDNKSEAVRENVEIIKQVLLSYNQECESIWFDLCRELMSQLILFGSATKDVLKTILDKAHSLHANSLQHTASIYKNKALVVSEGTSEVNNLRKLIILPLAHPNYQHKLEELYQQAKRIAKSRTKEYKEIVHNYQDNLQREHDDYVSKISVLKDTLENCHKEILETFSCKWLASRLQEVENSISNQLMDTVKDSLDFSPNQTTEIKKESIEGQDENKTSKTETSGIIKYPMSIWDDEESQIPECSDFPKFIEPQPAEKSYVLSLATSCLKDSVEIIQKLYKHFEDEAKNFEKEIASSLKNFEHDLSQAKLIYSSVCN